MLKSEQINGIVIAKFDNLSRFNALVAEPIKEELKSFFNAPNVKLILNLEGINFIDSTGFGVFLSIMKTANNSNGQFKICNVATEVMELFKLLQLHHIFEIYSNLNDCIKSFD